MKLPPKSSRFPMESLTMLRASPSLTLHFRIRHSMSFCGYSKRTACCISPERTMPMKMMTPLHSMPKRVHAKRITPIILPICQKISTSFFLGSERRHPPNLSSRFPTVCPRHFGQNSKNRNVSIDEVRLRQSTNMYDTNRLVMIVHAIDTEGPLHEPTAATFERLAHLFGVTGLPKTKATLGLLKEKKIPLGGKEEQVAQLLGTHSLDYKKNWQEVDEMLGRIMDTKFRNAFPDSYGGGWVYN